MMIIFLFDAGFSFLRWMLITSREKQKTYRPRLTRLLKSLLATQQVGVPHRNLRVCWQ